MNLTYQQQQQLVQGQPIDVEIEGEKCVLLTRQAFDRVKSSGHAASPSTAEESAVADDEPGTLSDLIGTWQTATTPTDDEIEGILEEERIRKHA